jgi:ubiquinone/menaquinone biosynthesis C-methylase UbiE
LFENVYNHKVYSGTGKKVAQFIGTDDVVLECACGTGAITSSIADSCKSVVATDFSEPMMDRAIKKCKGFSNVRFEKADITNLQFEEGSFDKVIAGNVIHLLPEPEKAYRELERVVKPGGKIIIPTYINKSNKAAGFGVKFVEMLGLKFNQQFDFESYKKFFAGIGCQNVEYYVVEGRMPCAIAVIDKQ